MGCTSSSEDEAATTKGRRGRPSTAPEDEAAPGTVARVDLGRRPSKSALKQNRTDPKRRVSWITGDELRKSADVVAQEEEAKHKRPASPGAPGSPGSRKKVTTFTDDTPAEPASEAEPTRSPPPQADGEGVAEPPSVVPADVSPATDASTGFAAVAPEPSPARDEPEGAVGSPPAPNPLREPPASEEGTA